MDITKLTKEQLLALIEQKDKALKEKDSIIKDNDKALKEKDSIIKENEKALKEKDKAIEKLEVEKRELNEKIELLIKKYESKVEKNRLHQAEKFMSKAEKLENIINESDSTTLKEKKKVNRKSPSETFVKELKEIVDEEITIDYDFEANHVDKSKVKPFGQEETIKIDIAPVDFVVKKIIRPKYKDKNNIYQAIVNDVFPHSVLTPSLASNIITMKFELGIPFYRYHQYMEGRGDKDTFK